MSDHQLPLPIRVMDAIEKGIQTARTNPKAGDESTSDGYVAWCIWNELRLAGFKVTESDQPQD